MDTIETPETRDAVLRAAREISLQAGVDAVSIKALTIRSGVSNGSVYHHFGSRGGVIATLILDTLAGYHREVIAMLEANSDDAEAGIKGLISHHLEWVEANPDDARLLMERRDKLAAGPHGDRLAAQTKDFLGVVKRWLKAQSEAGRMPDVGINLVHALTFAPAQELGSLWLNGRMKQRPTTFTDRLTAAGWAAIQAVPA